jgi:hypothetical protein
MAEVQGGRDRHRRRPRDFNARLEVRASKALLDGLADVAVMHDRSLGGEIRTALAAWIRRSRPDADDGEAAPPSAAQWEGDRADRDGEAR